MPLINGTLSPNADPAPPELTSGGGVMDWLSGMFGGERALPTLPAEPAGPARDAYAGQSMTMPRADFRPGTDLGGSVPMSAEQADRMREASMELHDATMLAGGPMGAEAGTGAVALASRRGLANPPPPSRGIINAAAAPPGEVSVLNDGTILSGETPVGRVKYDHGDQSTRIGDIQINPGMRNQGIGSAVIRQIQDEAAARGNPVVLSTDAFRGPQAQADQLRLYDRLGFQPNTGPGQVSERIGGRKVAEDLVWQPPGFTAYHGSPHLFPPTERNPLGEFDPVKIGTGEGAQAYGYGHYLADSEGVARSYRDDITAKQSQRSVTINTGGPFGPVEILEQDPTKTGHMYEVNVNAEPEHFLDWDKPLSEQSDAVKSLLPKLPDGVTKLPNGRWATTLQGDVIGRPDGWPDMSTAQYVSQTMRQDLGDTSKWTGSDLHRHLVRQNPGNKVAPTEIMQQAGIPGIRYLDAGSRGAGEGSRNTVVFSPEIMQVIRRYGLAGLMAGGGAAALGGQGQQQ